MMSQLSMMRRLLMLLTLTVINVPPLSAHTTVNPPPVVTSATAAATARATMVLHPTTATMRLPFYTSGPPSVLDATTASAGQHGIISDASCQSWMGRECANGVCYVDDIDNSTDCECALTKCRCDPGYDGDNCEIEIDNCASFPCYPRGDCTSLVNDYACSCRAPGFTPVNNSNKYCNEVDFCASGPCRNNGTCRNDTSRFKCNCPMTNSDILISGKQCENQTNLGIVKVKGFPTVTSISPTSGIVAGGTQLTVHGYNLDSLPDVLGVNLTASGLAPLYAFVNDSQPVTSSQFVVVMPPAIVRKSNDTYVDTDLAITVEYSGPYTITTDVRFRYVPNPDITYISPRQISVTGGVTLTVNGSNFDAVETPMMNVTVVTNEEQIGGIVSGRVNVTLSPCKHVGDDGKLIECQLPLLDLTDNLQRAAASNVTEAPINPWKLSGVAGITSGNESATLFLGFVMDDLTTLRNISRTKPSLKLSFVQLIASIASGDDRDFDPSTTSVLEIRGLNLTFGGLRATDYEIRVGNESCNVTSLSANVIVFSPPRVKPPPASNNNSCKQGLLPVTVTITLADDKLWVAYCIQYVVSSELPLILGLGIGIPLGILVIIAIVVAVRVCITRKHTAATSASKKTRKTPAGQQPQLKPVGGKVQTRPRRPCIDVNAPQGTASVQRHSPASSAAGGTPWYYNQPGRRQQADSDENDYARGLPDRGASTIGYGNDNNNGDRHRDDVTTTPYTPSDWRQMLRTRGAFGGMREFANKRISYTRPTRANDFDDSTVGSGSGAVGRRREDGAASSSRFAGYIRTDAVSASPRRQRRHDNDYSADGAGASWTAIRAVAAADRYRLDHHPADFNDDDDDEEERIMDRFVPPPAVDANRPSSAAQRGGTDGDVPADSGYARTVQADGADDNDLGSRGGGLSGLAGHGLVFRSPRVTSMLPTADELDENEATSPQLPAGFSAGGGGDNGGASGVRGRGLVLRTPRVTSMMPPTDNVVPTGDGGRVAGNELDADDSRRWSMRGRRRFWRDAS